jgi:CBS domain-containing protein
MDPQSIPPLDALPAEASQAFLAQGEEVAVAAGAYLLRQGGDPASHLYLVLAGRLALVDDEGDEEVESLGPGRFFAYTSLFSGAPPVFSAVARTPSRLLRFPKEALEGLLAYPEAARFFGKGLLERFHHLRIQLPKSDFMRPVGELVRRPAVFVSPTTTAAKAARTMRSEGVSSLLVEGEALGIVTDRDLRNRILAEGRPHTTPVAQIMTSPLFTLPTDTLHFEAVTAMLERGIHHLPLTQEGRVVGVITHTDLLAHQSQSPLVLLKRIERLELSRYAQEVTQLVAGLVQAGLTSLDVGRVVAGLNDALIRRLLKEAERALGPAPIPYSFFVFGSEGRKEQALLTDQDNALAVAAAGHEAYFEAMAKEVVEGLIAAGIPPCPGGYMATRWLKALEGWQAHFVRWMETPEPQALLDAQIFFDLRAVGGELSLAPLEALILERAHEGLFLYHLAAASLTFRPPLGVFGRVRTEEGFVDLKRHALAPIVALARVYGLLAKSAERGTLSRLKRAAAAGVVSEDLAARLAETYERCFRLRLEQQLQALTQDQPLSNKLVWRDLPSREQKRLLEGFRAIGEAQEGLRLRFHLRR